MNELIASVERRQLRKLPAFREGDRLRVHFQVVEGTRRRTQVFEGIVLKIQGAGSRRTFTVRKLSFGVGVERTFPLHSPKIECVEVMARGEVRRAKLYYLRGRIGRRARVTERRDLTPEELSVMGEMPSAEVEARAAAAAAEKEAAEAPQEPADMPEQAADNGEASATAEETPEADQPGEQQEEEEPAAGDAK